MTASLDTVAPVTFDLTNAEAPPPPPPPVIRTAVGAGSGGAPAVKVIDSTGTERLSLLAYVADFTGGVRVATADFTGDGVDDVVTGAGPLGSSHVKVFDGVTGAELRSFFAYDPSARYGVFVAAADLDGDGVAELVTGAGEGGAPHVKVFRYADLAETASFFAFDPAQRGGVSVAAQAGLVVAGSGVGVASEVRVFAAGSLAPVGAFAPFGGFTGGVNVTADSGLIGVGAGRRAAGEDLRGNWGRGRQLLPIRPSVHQRGVGGEPRRGRPAADRRGRAGDGPVGGRVRLHPTGDGLVPGVRPRIRRRGVRRLGRAVSRGATAVPEAASRRHARATRGTDGDSRSCSGAPAPVRGHGSPS